MVRVEGELIYLRLERSSTTLYHGIGNECIGVWSVTYEILGELKYPFTFKSRGS